MIRPIPILVALSLIGSTARAAPGQHLSPCATDRLIYSWTHQGFPRTDKIYDPPRYNLGNWLIYVGKVRTGNHMYKIFFDEGSDPQTRHGHQDVIVVTGAGKYLGFYEVNDADLEPLLTKDADIYFEPPEDDPLNRDGTRIHFGVHGPPRTANLNGHEVTLEVPVEDHKYPYKSRPWPEPRSRIASYCRR